VCTKGQYRKAGKGSVKKGKAVIHASQNKLKRRKK